MKKHFPGEIVEIPAEQLTWLLTLAEAYLDDLTTGIEDGTYENTKENKDAQLNGYLAVEAAHKALT